MRIPAVRSEAQGITVPSVNGLLYRRRITGTPRRLLPRVGQVRAHRHDLTKDQELEVIKSGSIRCRPADIHDTSMQIIDSTAIVLTTLDSTPWRAGANPLRRQRGHAQPGGARILASMSFTRASLIALTEIPH